MLGLVKRRLRKEREADACLEDPDEDVGGEAASELPPLRFGASFLKKLRLLLGESRGGRDSLGVTVRVRSVDMVAMNVLFSIKFHRC